jgi:photosystem II stability/assembly factor-like uncharacterized protein
MKKFFFILIIIHFTLLIVYSQSGWSWLNPLPQLNDLYDIKFVDDNTGYAVGNSGTIIKTTNGGINWFFCSEQRCGLLRQLNIINQNVIYAGGDQKLCRSSDAGITWNYIYNNLSILSMFFLNEFTGYAGTNFGNILKTTNGGKGWTTYVTTPAYDINSLYFFDITNGYLCNHNTIQRTSNGGVNWTVVLQDTISTTFYSIIFINSNTGFACGSYGRMVKTTNGGNNWFSQNTGIISTLKSISYLNSNNIVCCGITGTLIKSSDGGSTWTQVYSGNADDFNAVCCKSINSSYACGTSGALLKSTENGTNWFNLNFGFSENLSDCYFINSQTGYITSISNIMIKTTNSGINWEFINIGTYNTISRVFFRGPNTGYIGGNSGWLIKTTNAGANWFNLSTGFSADILAIFFVNAQTGYIGMSTVFEIIHTSDGGDNWDMQSIPVDGVVTKIWFTNANTGFAGTGTGNIVKTTNGGINWYSNYVSGFYIHGLDFLDENTGYAINDYQLIKTTNCGNNWFVLLANGGSGLSFANANTGYVLQPVFLPTGSCGAVYRTTDGGLTWTFDYPGTSYYVRCIFAVSPDTCFIAGDKGSIMVHRSGLVNIETKTKNIPDKFSLSQNYPNPFNPATTIKFDIPPSKGVRGMNVKLIIYDVLGREVATLVNEQLKPGNYEVEWDGSNYPSGVYFYKLITNSFSETKRMVLIK